VLFTYAYLGAFALSRKAPVTLIVSACLSASIGAALPRRFDLEFDIGDFCERLSINSRFG
jgi:hypothetical protein